MKERLLEFLAYLQIGQNAFERRVGLSIGYVNKCTGNMEMKTLDLIQATYPELNIEWLKYGDDKGKMLKGIHAGNTDIVSFDKLLFSDYKQRGYAPFWTDLQVSAGQYDLATIKANDEPTSFIKIEGVTASDWFPVVGFSMEPKIHAGDIIAVRDVERWEKVDPDKIYMIVTQDDRMIKHLRPDNNDVELLWCFSENYKEFKLHVSEIKSVHQVVFVGRLV